MSARAAEDTTPRPAPLGPRAAAFAGAVNLLVAGMGLICHQRAERSFHLSGEQMAFCQRDLAIVGGFVFVAMLYGLLRRRLPASIRFRWAAVAALPMAVDGLTQLAGLRESTWELRVLTGMLFSAGIGWYVLPHLDAGFVALAQTAGSDELAAKTAAP
jgi:uncharacterized membrane protein